MNHSTRGLHHQFLEFTQIHVHRVGDAIQTSHPLPSPCPPAPNPSQLQGLFQWVNSAAGGQSTGVSASASVLPMNIQDWPPLGWTGWILLAVQGTLKSLLQHHNSKASILWHSAFFTVQLSHPYTTTGKTRALTSLFLYPLCFSQHDILLLSVYLLPPSLKCDVGEEEGRILCVT